MRFGEVLDAADQLSVEEQEELVEVLHRRVIERRREEIAAEIQEARHEYESGACRPSTPEDILKDILS